MIASSERGTAGALGIAGPREHVEPGGSEISRRPTIPLGESGSDGARRVVERLKVRPARGGINGGDR
jgi:hypothetical protein